MPVLFFVFPPFIIAMSVLAASAAFYRRMSAPQDESSYWDSHPRSIFQDQTPSLPTQTPLEIAQERYARGELGHEEFDQIIGRLNQSRQTWQKW
ncbi:hypothetical protein CO251_08310 [Sulfobacillus sp. hq2]|nr:hypothetical protein CO251_08310 [Sulfobacillus sp. hq2]